MWHFAQEFSQTLHALRTLDEIGVKTAFAEAAHLSGKGVRVASSELYEVLSKTASADNKELTHPLQVDVCVLKMAQLLGKNPPSDDLRAKIAAAVAVDDTLCRSLKSDLENQTKIAEARDYGREFLMELLRTVL